MDNFTNVTGGYNKQEVNEFVEYVIKKTEDNILTIRKTKRRNREFTLRKRKTKKIRKLLQIHPRPSRKHSKRNKK